jgi:hypothetical protein
MNSQQAQYGSNNAAGASYAPQPRQDMIYLCAGELESSCFQRGNDLNARVKTATHGTRSSHANLSDAENAVTVSCIKAGQSGVRIPDNTVVRRLTWFYSGSI